MEGHTTIWVGTQPDPNDRTQIQLPHSEFDKLTHFWAGGHVWVTDVNGKQHHLRSADCGLPNCMCALDFVDDVRVEVVPMEKPKNIGTIIHEVLQERARQDAKWGEQNHNPYMWIAILGEEVGEVSKAALETTFGIKSEVDYRRELIEVAAVAIAAVESFDRNGWPREREGG